MSERWERQRERKAERGAMCVVRGQAWEEGDILGFAADLDSRTLPFGRNGDWSVDFTNYGFIVYDILKVRMTMLLVTLSVDVTVGILRKPMLSCGRAGMTCLMTCVMTLCRAR